MYITGGDERSLEQSFWVTPIPEYDQSKHPRVHSINLCRYGKWIYMYILCSKGPIIIYRQGGLGGERAILGGITWVLGEQKEDQL